MGWSRGGVYNPSSLRGVWDGNPTQSINPCALCQEDLVWHVRPLYREKGSGDRPIHVSFQWNAISALALAQFPTSPQNAHCVGVARAAGWKWRIATFVGDSLQALRSDLSYQIHSCKAPYDILLYLSMK